MRQYEPIWNKLKQKGTAVITATPQLHSRIRKAVIKEKDNDLAFKLTSSEEGKRYRIIVTSKGQVLQFDLKDISL